MVSENTKKPRKKRPPMKPHLVYGKRRAVAPFIGDLRGTNTNQSHQKEKNHFRQAYVTGNNTRPGDEVECGGDT